MGEGVRAGVPEKGPVPSVMVSAWRPCRADDHSFCYGAGHFLALRARALLAALPDDAEDVALLRSGVGPDLELSLRLRQRKRRVLSAAVRAGNA